MEVGKKITVVCTSQEQIQKTNQITMLFTTSKKNIEMVTDDKTIP